MSPNNAATLGWIAALTLAGILVCRAWRRGTGRPLAWRVAAAAAPFFVVVALLAVVGRCSFAPFEDDENGVRLASVYTIAYGHPLYAPPDRGLIYNQPYAPMGYLAFLPVTLLRTPVAALVAASLLVAGFFYLPALWWHLPRGDTSDRRWLATILAMIVFVLGVALSPAMCMPPVRTRPDAIALGFAMAACAAAFAGKQRLGLGRSLVACVLACLAVWSKQPLAPIVVALPVGVGLLHGWRAGGRFILVMAVTGVVVSGVFFAAFWPPQILLWNIVIGPSKHAWLPHGWRDWIGYANDLQLECRLPLVLFTAAAVIRWTRRPAGVTSAAQFFDANRWLLLAVVALVMLPMALWQRIRVGGGPGAWVLVDYFLLAAATVGLATLLRDESARLAEAVAVVVVVLAASMTLALLPQTLAWWRDAADYKTSRAQQVYDFCRAHPGEAYFPWHPLSTLLAEGRLYNCEEGAENIEMGGVKITSAHFLENLPPKMKYIAIPEAWDRAPSTLPMFPRYTARVRLPGLPGWRVFTTPEAAAAP